MSACSAPYDAEHLMQPGSPHPLVRSTARDERENM